MIPCGYPARAAMTRRSMPARRLVLYRTIVIDQVPGARCQRDNGSECRAPFRRFTTPVLPRPLAPCTLSTSTPLGTAGRSLTAASTTARTRTLSATVVVATAVVATAGAWSGPDGLDPRGQGPRHRTRMTAEDCCARVVATWHAGRRWAERSEAWLAARNRRRRHRGCATGCSARAACRRRATACTCRCREARCAARSAVAAASACADTPVGLASSDDREFGRSGFRRFERLVFRAVRLDVRPRIACRAPLPERHHHAVA